VTVVNALTNEKLPLPDRGLLVEVEPCLDSEDSVDCECGWVLRAVVLLPMLPLLVRVLRVAMLVVEVEVVVGRQDVKTVESGTSGSRMRPETDMRASASMLYKCTCKKKKIAVVSQTLHVPADRRRTYENKTNNENKA
jgi:hypothetical protein